MLQACPAGWKLKLPKLRMHRRRSRARTSARSTPPRGRGRTSPVRLARRLRLCHRLAIRTPAQDEFWRGLGPFERYGCGNWCDGLDDFCLWAPPKENSLIADTEGEEVAWCTKKGWGTRLMVDGTLQGAQLLKTNEVRARLSSPSITWRRLTLMRV